ncbi:DUF1304 domain-containing protein [Marinilactibacillus sp. XAAS-LB27]|uniref:DUF1304 domain-containing protein n=1 Tax=Marinilactibacillus sp. XAAS-LB27 TaxID=3114538 RepID=UPI002E174A76|nr:DUF1304 domain-containing protein [Marinilactibacillus sp. XAAS-LB27]
MSILSTILTTVVALEFFYIFYIQTIKTTSSTTSRIFNMNQNELKQKSLNTLLKNQGVYNGLIGLGLLYSTFFSTASLEITRLILIYIILVALYGSITSSRKIILTQGGPAIIALISTVF